MADTKISSLTALTGANVDTAADLLAIVDTSVTTTKKILIDELRIALGIATQAQQETGTSLVLTVTPGRQQFHPSAAKWWAQADAGGIVNLSYNLTSVTDGGVGAITATIATDFSGGNWSALISIFSGSGNIRTAGIVDQTAGSLGLECWNQLFAAADPIAWYFAGFGDQ